MNNHVDTTYSEPRAWWAVRPTLIATLAALISLLVAVLSRPELLDKSISAF